VGLRARDPLPATWERAERVSSLPELARSRRVAVSCSREAPMIEPPAGWAFQPGVNGAMLLPPDGGGRVRAYDRLPLQSLGSVLAEILGRDPAFIARKLGSVIEGATHEGEHALWLRVDGERGGVPALRTLGVVCGDDFLYAIDTLVVDARRF